MTSSNEKNPKIPLIPGGLILVKRRPTEERGRIRRDITIDKYWISKTTGMQVEVKTFVLVDGTKPEVRYLHPIDGRVHTCPLEKFKELYATYGNISSKF